MQPVPCALEVAEEVEAKEVEAEAALLDTQASRMVTAENMHILGQAARSQRMTPVAEAPGDAMAVAGPTVVAVTAKCDNVVEHVEQYHLVLHRLRYIIDSILLCHLSEESIVSLHRFLCITRHVLPLLILSGGSAIKNLSRQPAAKTSVQDGLCKINNGKISTIKWYGSQTRTPSSSWSHAALIGLRVQRFLWLVCIRYL